MVMVAELERKIDTLLKRQEALERENRILREENALLRQARFGRSSERMDPGQLALFLGQAAEAAPEPAKVAVPAHDRAQKGHGRSPFAEHLPRNTISCELPECDRVCGCGLVMQPIGDDVSERGHVVPARIVVNRYVRKKYACPSGHGIVTAPAPEGVIERAKYEASVYAYLATAKYCDHLPLNRLEAIFRRQGVQLPKQSMWDMLVRLDEIVAQPVLRQMRVELLEEAVLHADETPVTLRLEEGKGTRQGYAWCWRNLREEHASKVLMEFRMSRSRDGPTAFLGDWSGTLIIDGYTGYDDVVARNGIVRAGCWSHARRKLKEALDGGSREAARVLVHVQRLFRMERALAERSRRSSLDAEAVLALRTKVRASRGRRLVKRIYAAADELACSHATLPKSKLGKALGYLDRQREPLSVFIADPRVPLHNNDAERDVRHLAIGRKNWLVFGSQRGGDVACRLYSLVLSCRQNGADPQAYLEDVLARVATTPAKQIASLTPWAWSKTREAAASTGA